MGAKHRIRGGLVTTSLTLLIARLKQILTFPPYNCFWILQSDTNDQDIRTEPKFNLPDGDLFTDPWCRPQNDGPGLQAITLIKFAYQLMAQGDEEYVKKYLWTGDQVSLVHEKLYMRIASFV